ncbi:MAG: HAMP domain-containing protein, partial [Alphaproteobacteria bacterium]
MNSFIHCMTQLIQINAKTSAFSTVVNSSLRNFDQISSVTKRQLNTKSSGLSGPAFAPREARSEAEMMKWLNSVKLAPKLLAAVVFLTLVSATIAAIALQSLWRVSAITETMEAAQKRSLSAGRATSNLLAYFRHVEFLPISLSEEARRSHENDANEELRRLLGRIDELEKSVMTEEGRRAVMTARDVLAKYRLVHDQIAAISRAGDFDKAGAIALEHSTAADVIRKELRGVEDRSLARAQELVKQVKAAENFAETMIGLVALLGIGIGIGFSLFIIIVGVTRPLGQMSQTMNELAKGRTDLDVPGADRKDEVGDMGRAVLVFRDNARERLRLEERER